MKMAADKGRYTANRHLNNCIEDSLQQAAGNALA